YDHVGVPGFVGFTHFHSSTTSGAACRMSLRILPKVAPRQSPSSAILFEMSSDADLPWLVLDSFIFSSSKSQGDFSLVESANYRDISAARLGLAGCRGSRSARAPARFAAEDRGPTGSGFFEFAPRPGARPEARRASSPSPRWPRDAGRCPSR